MPKIATHDKFADMMDTNDKLALTWAQARNLTFKDFPYGNASSPRQILDKGKFDQELSALEREHGILSTHFDHARYFVLPPARTRCSVMITSPYEQTALMKFNTREEYFEDIQHIAADLGLLVRGGYNYDVIYKSTIPGNPTIPIVWWNPDRIDLLQIERQLGFDR